MKKIVRKVIISLFFVGVSSLVMTTGYLYIVRREMETDSLQKDKYTEIADKIIAVTQEENPIKDGPFEQVIERYHPNGKLRVQGKWEGLNRFGTWKRWDENGTLIHEDTYSDNETRRVFIDYFPNGQKKRTGEMVNGKETGIWEAWNESGKYLGSITYNDGKRVKMSVER